MKPQRENLTRTQSEIYEEEGLAAKIENGTSEEEGSDEEIEEENNDESIDEEEENDEAHGADNDETQGGELEETEEELEDDDAVGGAGHAKKATEKILPQQKSTAKPTLKPRLVKKNAQPIPKMIDDLLSSDNVESRKGLSLVAIKAHILSNYPKEQNESKIIRSIKLHLKKSISNGTIKNTTAIGLQGSFKLVSKENKKKQKKKEAIEKKKPKTAAEKAKVQTKVPKVAQSKEKLNIKIKPESSKVGKMKNGKTSVVPSGKAPKATTSKEPEPLPVTKAPRRVLVRKSIGTLAMLPKPSGKAPKKVVKAVANGVKKAKDKPMAMPTKGQSKKK